MLWYEGSRKCSRKKTLRLHLYITGNWLTFDKNILQGVDEEKLIF